jgi:Icc-related predicted phosphoesterase
LGSTLWTDFGLFKNAPLSEMQALTGMNDYKLIKYGLSSSKLTPYKTRLLHETSVSFLQSKISEPFGGKTVVVTHHAPSIKSIPEEYLQDPISAAYASNLEHIMLPNVNLWIHGHVHNSCDYMVDGVRVVCNPRGYQHPQQSKPENDRFDTHLVLEL